MKKELNKAFNWEVEEKQVLVDGYPDRNYKALVRSDRNEVLSIMSGRYRTFRNGDLAKLCEDICKYAGFGMAGFDEFRRGKLVIAYLETNRKGVKVNGHNLQEYLTIGNTHDGSGKIFIGTANYLFRCENQFSRIFRVFDTPHTRDLRFDSEEIRDIVNQFRNGSDELYGKFELMKQIRIDQGLIDQLVREVLETNMIDSSEVKGGEREELLRAGIKKETEALGNNVWGLFNGVTWYTSHDLRNSRGGIGNVNGVAQLVNEKAFKFCTNIL